MKLLIVDDQKTVAAGLLKLVDWESVGIDEAFGANSAQEAKEILKAHKIDVMLSDIEMPVENGLSLFRWVKNQGMDLKCIFLTAHAEFAYAKESISLGAFDYVVQPARYGEIKDAVRRAVISKGGNPVSEQKESVPDTRAVQEIKDEGDAVDQVISYIDDNMEKEIHRSELVELVHLNADYLNRLFKERKGKTLREYIIERKMEEAKRMLQETRLPVSIIAGKVGYDNFSHFSYAYKKVYGQSPLESRNAYQQGKN